jgi:uncharacterized membrane protein YgdD (TMEM256/DUF423 family)
MSKNWLVTGFLFAALAVILGAFAAHGLKAHLDDGKIDLQGLQNFETGARYQMYHAFALMICGFLAKFYGEKRSIKIAAILFIAGIIFFSGSLYLLSTRDIIGLNNWKWLGPVTPLGGTCFIAGWITLAVCIFKEK